MFKNKFSNNYNNFGYCLTNNNSHSNSLELLDLYENSYFWFIKRFYFFNTLPSNFIKTNASLTSPDSSSNKTLLNKHDYAHLKHSAALSFLLKSRFLTLFPYSVYLYEDFNDNLSLNKFNTFSDHFFNFKDLYLFYSDNEILSKDSLNIVY
jgi:hypothetical protein